MRPTVSLLVVLVSASAVWAEGASWEAVDALQARLRQAEEQMRQEADQLAVLREAAATEAIAAARKALAEAEAAEAAAHTEAGLDAQRDALRQAQAARDAAADKLLAAGEAGREALQRHEAMGRRIEVLTQRLSDLGVREVAELAALRRSHRALGGQIYGARRALWERGEVLPLYRKADGLYKAYGQAVGKSQPFKAAQDRTRQARKALEAALAAADPQGSIAEAVQARHDAASKDAEALKAQIETQRKALLEGAKDYAITVAMPPRKGVEQKPARVTLWVPPCESVRGVIIAHPMIGKMATHPTIRDAAARSQLATMVMPNYSFNGAETVQRVDAMLEEFAQLSGRNELKGAALLPAGLSASVLAARNVGYAAPGRVLGIVHVAGGNMHHNIVDPKQTLSGVPFIAFNGELEWCGPEGGIRPEYGRQTQWVMIREQLLRRWRSDHQHLMSLVVVPGADHGAWDVDLAALFVRKAVQFRAPRQARDGSKPAACEAVKAEQGWLTDADLDHPTHAPAAFGDYAGDRDHAFWHFDEEMARAVAAYHKGRFLLPDPTKAAPVSPDWPTKGAGR